MPNSKSLFEEALPLEPPVASAPPVTAQPAAPAVPSGSLFDEALPATLADESKLPAAADDSGTGYALRKLALQGAMVDWFRGITSGAPQFLANVALRSPISPLHDPNMQTAVLKSVDDFVQHSWLNENIKDWYTPSPEDQAKFLETLGPTKAALARASGQLIPSILSIPLGVLSFAGQSYEQTAEEAAQFTPDLAKQHAAGLFAGTIGGGMSMVNLPVTRWGMAALPGGGRKLAARLSEFPHAMAAGHISLGGLTNFLQGAAYTAANNIVASDLLEYDPERALSANVWPSAEVGGITGLMASGMIHALGMRGKTGFKNLRVEQVDEAVTNSREFTQHLTALNEQKLAVEEMTAARELQQHELEITTDPVRRDALIERVNTNTHSLEKLRTSVAEGEVALTGLRDRYSKSLHDLGLVSNLGEGVTEAEKVIGTFSKARDFRSPLPGEQVALSDTLATRFPVKRQKININEVRRASQRKDIPEREQRVLREVERKMLETGIFNVSRGEMLAAVNDYAVPMKVEETPGDLPNTSNYRISFARPTDVTAARLTAVRDGEVLSVVKHEKVWRPVTPVEKAVQMGRETLSGDKIDESAFIELTKTAARQGIRRIYVPETTGLLKPDNAFGAKLRTMADGTKAWAVDVRPEWATTPVPQEGSPQSIMMAAQAPDPTALANFLGKVSALGGVKLPSIPTEKLLSWVRRTSDDVGHFNKWNDIFDGIRQWRKRNPTHEGLIVADEARHPIETTRMTWIKFALVRTKDLMQFSEDSRARMAELTFGASKISDRVGRKLTDVEMARLAAGEDMEFNGPDGRFSVKLSRPLTNPEYRMARAALDDFPEAAKYLINVVRQNTAKQIENLSPEEGAQLMEEVAHLEAQLNSRTYYPQVRTGKYFIRLIAKERMVVEGVQYDIGQSFHNEAYPSEREQNRAVADLRKVYDAAKVQVEPHINTASEPEVVYQIPPRLQEALNKLELDPMQKDELTRLMAQLHPVRGYAESLLPRRSIEGYSHDMAWAHKNYFIRFANYIAKAEHGPALREAVPISRRIARQAAERGEDPRTLEKIAGAVQEMVEYTLNPQNEWNALRGATIVYHLGMVPKTALINAAAIPMFVYPYFASRYGSIKTLGALKTATFKNPEVDQAIAQATKLANALHTTKMAAPDGLGEILYDLELNNALTQTTWLDAAAMREVPNEQRMGFVQRLGFGTKKIGELSMAGFSYMEGQNRRTTAIAAYLLEMKRASSKKWADLPDAERDLIKRKVRDAVLDTNWDYSRSNRAWLIRGKKGAAFAFANWWLHAVRFYTQEKGGGTALLMLLAVAGLEGLPGAKELMDVVDIAAAVNNRVREAMGHGETFFDADTRLRKFIGDVMETEDANVIDMIANGAAFHWGLGPLEMLVPEPRTGPGGPPSGTAFTTAGSFGMASPAESALALLRRLARGSGVGNADTQTVEAIGGATGSMVMRMYQFITAPDKEAADRALDALPTALRHILKARKDYAQEGALRSDRSPLKPYDHNNPRDNMELLLRAAGFSPRDLTQQKRKDYFLTEFRAYWTARRESKVARFKQAVFNNDQAAMDKTREDIFEFNGYAPDFAKISADSLRKSIKQSERARAVHEATGVPDTQVSPEEQEIIDLYTPHAEVPRQRTPEEMATAANLPTSVEVAGLELPLSEQQAATAVKFGSNMLTTYRGIEARIDPNSTALDDARLVAKLDSIPDLGGAAQFFGAAGVFADPANFVGISKALAMTARGKWYASAIAGMQASVQQIDDPEAQRNAGLIVAATNLFLSHIPGLAQIVQGRRSRNWDAKAAEKAEKVLDEGASPAEVYLERGYTRGFEEGNRMRSYVSDEGFKVRMIPDLKVNETADHLLPEVIHHPALFHAYPELASTRVRFINTGDAASGQYDAATDMVTIWSPGSPLRYPVWHSRNLIHELTHAVQRIEGFARGGTPRGMMEMFPLESASYATRYQGLMFTRISPDRYRFNQDGLAALAASMRPYGNFLQKPIPGDVGRSVEDILQAWKEGVGGKLLTYNRTLQLSNQMSQYQLYLQLAGEIEAREAEILMLTSQSHPEIARSLRPFTLFRPSLEVETRAPAGTDALPVILLRERQ